MAQDYNHLGFISEVPRGVQGMSTLYLTYLPGLSATVILRDSRFILLQMCKHL
jgi:hypothetical protein